MLRKVQQLLLRIPNSLARPNTLKKIARVTRAAEQNLNRLFSQWHADSKSEHREFYALRLQCASIQYELCAQMGEFLQAEPHGYGRKIALKDLLHKAFEYDQTLRKHHVQRLISLAESRHMTVTVERLRRLCREWKKPLEQLAQFKDLRNAASGHYDPDIVKQVDHVAGIIESDALDAIRSFMAFTLAINKILRDVGRGEPES